MPLTVGQLAKRFGLSRSTLLYYDRIGLLRPAGRTESNYRLYSNSDVERLNPEAHEEFLTSLGIPHEEVGEIRKRSRSR